MAIGRLATGVGITLALAAPTAHAATINVACGDPAALIDAIKSANSAAGPDTIALGAGCTYALKSVNQYWFGPNGLPPVSSAITIEGNGATITRDPSAPAFRFFFVGADPANPVTPGYLSPGAGSLTLHQLVLKGGLAKGGDSYGGGGGAGLGGAIFAMGPVTVDASTVSGNAATGGVGDNSFTGFSGAGIGSNAGMVTAGGFGGSVTPAGSVGQGKTFGGGGGTGFAGEVGANGTDTTPTMYAATGGAGGGPRTTLGGDAGPSGFTHSGNFGSHGGGRGGDGSGAGGASAYLGTAPQNGGDFGSGGAVSTAGNPGDGGGGGGVGGGGSAGRDSGNEAYAGGGGGGGGFGGGGGRGGSVLATNTQNYTDNGGYGGLGGFGGGAGGNGTNSNGQVVTGSINGGFGGGAGNGAKGGAGAGMGGAIFAMQTTLTVRNSTFDANAATGGATGTVGQGYGGAIFNLQGATTLDGSTFAANTATRGDGAPDLGQALFTLTSDQAAARDATTTLRDTIVWDTNDTGKYASDVSTYNVSTASGGNAKTDVSQRDLVHSAKASEGNAFTIGTPDARDPLLGALQANGGPTPTRLPGTGSPALDGGGSAVGLTTDQRGLPRPSGKAADIGAVETQVPPAPAGPGTTGTTGGPGATTTPADRTAPTFTSAPKLSTTRFAVDTKGKAEAAKAKTIARGTTLRFTLSEAATIRATVQKASTGRKIGTTCVKPTKANRKRHACTRYPTAATFRFAAPKGATAHHFTARIAKKRLATGRYRLQLVAVDAAGNRSSTKTVSFTIVRL